MKSMIRQAALAAVLALGAGGASAAATVSYAQPERFSDVPFAPWERERVLAGLTEHFNKLAARLPPGQDLSVEVLDLDLAGEIWPTRLSAQDLRIMNGRADWPRLSMRYSITQGGQVVSSGEENLSDMGYMNRINRYFGGDALRYEKQMLDDWFKTRIAAR
ncbi:MAG: DUF3016 domain-containing protein [Massilia sp.]|nr:DUF3016 domain-containing protein [Massilia sp.]